MEVMANERSGKMDDVCTYRIEIRGMMSEEDLNTMSPHQLTIEKEEEDSIIFTIQTDQSGLIGLIRYLHGRGLIFLSILREH
jgi:hypothetical protein